MNSSQEKNSASGSCEFQDNLSVLRDLEFFSGIPLEILKVFAYLCTRQTFQANDYLFEQNEDDGMAYYIISGRTALTYKNDEGEQVIQNYEPDQFIGGLALLGTMHRLFSLKALEKIQCLTITREKFSKTIEQFPQLIPNLFQTIVDRIHRWEKRILVEQLDDQNVCSKVAGVSLI
jgi:CRP-like cAMP-binding protein